MLSSQYFLVALGLGFDMEEVGQDSLAQEQRGLVANVLDVVREKRCYLPNNDWRQQLEQGCQR